MTILFDMDGTLLNTIDDLTNAVNYTMEQMNLEIYSSQSVQAMVGDGIVKLLERALTGATTKMRAEVGVEQVSNNVVGDSCQNITSPNDLELALSIFKPYYKEHSRDFTRPYAGIVDMLVALKEKGYKLAVVTNKIESEALSLTKEFFAMVDECVGDDGIHRVKPATDNCFRALEKLHETFGQEITPSECIYIGDGGQDFETAKNFGVRFVGVSWGFRGREYLEGLGADVVVDTPAQLEDFLVSLMNDFTG